ICVCRIRFFNSYFETYRSISLRSRFAFSFFFTTTAPTEIYTLSLHDALPISNFLGLPGVLSSRFSSLLRPLCASSWVPCWRIGRSEVHTSELQSRGHLVCRLLLEKKNIQPLIDSSAYSLAHPTTITLELRTRP